MLGKEDATKIDLTKWFEENGFKVWWERKVQGLLFETFKVSGTSGRKPDLVIEKDGLYSAIEVKSGKTIETLQSRKIQEYYKDHSNGLSKYIINGNEVKISYFLIANQFSIEGKLLDEEGADLIKCDKWNRYLGYPRYEYPKTKLITRVIINDFIINKEIDDIRNKNIGYGFVLSTRLMTGYNVVNDPTFFIMKFDHREKKQKWKQWFGDKLWNTTK